jgi:hypothetical protein
MVQIPSWSVRDADAGELVPPDGWLHDYVEYMEGGTDAPLIYHIGCGLTALAASAANTTLCSQRSDGRLYDLPLQLWSILVGTSGDRKSRCMEVAVELFTRARETSELPDAILPSDGSMEAWHDFMAEAGCGGNVLLYRDEIAFLLDQSRRGYSEGLKSWLMTLYSGRRHARVIRPRQGEGKEVRRIAIERPRLSILGGIPPDTFRAKTGRGDWRSGFLARMVFWPATRERFLEMPTSDKHSEMALARWLNRVAVRSRGRLLVPTQGAQAVSEWYYREVESQRGDLPPEVFSHLTRYQDLGLKVAALYSLSRQDKPLLSESKTISVTYEDVEMAVRLISVLKRAAYSLYATFQASGEGEVEVEVLETLSRVYPLHYSITDLQRELPHYSLKALRGTLGELMKAGLVVQGKKITDTSTKGRPSVGFRFMR